MIDFFFFVHPLVCEDSDRSGIFGFQWIGRITAACADGDRFSIDLIWLKKGGKDAVLRLLTERILHIGTDDQCKFVPADPECVIIAADAFLKTFGHLF